MTRVLLLLAVAAFWLLSSSPAGAYPQWQLTTGATRCNQCHHAPGGGGPLTGFGRDAAGEDLSTISGDGAFLHGALELPARLTLGGHLRGALLAHDAQDPDGTTLAAFPMQAEVDARWAPGAGISVYASVGLRAQVRSQDAPVPTQNYQPTSTSRLISREHYLTWQPASLGPYLRAGRFYAPFGLRLAEHVLYVRRDLGFNQLEESYNLSGGYLDPRWEVHLTAFAPDGFRHIGNAERGFCGYFERRLGDDRATVGAQTRIADGPGVTRMIAGVTGKFLLPRLRTLLLGELDGVKLLFDSPLVGTRHQLVGVVGAAVLPVRGLMLTVLAERFHKDLSVRDAAWNAYDLLINWFPFPHFEAQLAARLQRPAAGVSTRTLLLQLHYYL